MRTLVISRDLTNEVGSELRRLLRAKIDTNGPAACGFEDVEAKLCQLRPDFIAVVLTGDTTKALNIIRTARRKTPSYLIAVGDASEPKLILQALKEGADHYLDQNDLDSGLSAILPRLSGHGGEYESSGDVWSILASCGGVGGSTLAVNLAAALAKSSARCALIDLKPGRGDLAALLDLKPQFNLADICLNAARADHAMFEKVLVNHKGGVSLLGAPQLFGDTRVVTTQGVSKTLSFAKQLFPQVVVDLEDCFHEEQVIALRESSLILLILRLDFTSLRNTRRILNHLRELGIPRERVCLVVNRRGQPNELPFDEAEEALGDKLKHFIPDDPRTFNGANNAGEPAVLKYPKEKGSLAIFRIAREFSEWIDAHR